MFNRYNADDNLEAGVKHLKYLYQKYNRNIPLTLAAYNAGEEAVSKYNGVPPYPETKQYIRRVMSLMGMSYTFSPTAPAKDENLQIHDRGRKNNHHRYAAGGDQRHDRDTQLRTEFASNQNQTRYGPGQKHFFWRRRGRNFIHFPDR